MSGIVTNPIYLFSTTGEGAVSSSVINVLNSESETSEGINSKANNTTVTIPPAIAPNFLRDLISYPMSLKKYLILLPI